MTSARIERTTFWTGIRRSTAELRSLRVFLHIKIIPFIVYLLWVRGSWLAPALQAWTRTTMFRQQTSPAILFIKYTYPPSPIDYEACKARSAHMLVLMDHLHNRACSERFNVRAILRRPFILPFFRSETLRSLCPCNSLDRKLYRGAP